MVDDLLMLLFMPLAWLMRLLFKRQIEVTGRHRVVPLF
jgi:hypothetical protein